MRSSGSGSSAVEGSLVTVVGARGQQLGGSAAAVVAAEALRQLRQLGLVDEED